MHISIMWLGDMYVGGHKISTLTGWILWRWPPSPAPAARLCETVRSASCRCGPDSGAARPECGRLSACSPVSTTWAPSAPPSPAVPGPMGLQPATTVPQMWCRDPAALLPGRSAPPRPWGGKEQEGIWIIATTNCSFDSLSVKMDGSCLLWL